ncbi:MAG: RNA-binding protein [Sedimentisphaerales bacterium]|nr:RNA-binding protein [Sedimentisphaerales bacterium]
MTKKVYVGNLSAKVDTAMLESWFTEFGTVESANIVMDRETGQSKGFGFVQMSSEQEAQAAMDALNGKEIEGRILKIAEANPPKTNKPRFGGGGGGGNRRPGGFGGGPRGGGNRGPGGNRGNDRGGDRGGRGGFGRR